MPTLSLEKTVLQEASTIFNRLISFARNYKDQYWLYERQIELYRLPSLNNQFDTQARLQDHDWIRWYPPAEHVIHATLFDLDKSIHIEDWTGVQAFASSNSRPDIVLELLANADLFIAELRRRNAIIESVTALEIAVARFTSAPKFRGLRTEDELRRLNIVNLKSQYEHIGFSSTVGYLLPLLFPSEVLPLDILQRCQDAIEQRNTVIHKGQRDIDPEIIQTLVSALRSVCEILDAYTDRP
jgi:hypothetical protein